LTNRTVEDYEVCFRAAERGGDGRRANSAAGSAL
jgi:hypothetical protein